MMLSNCFSKVSIQVLWRICLATYTSDRALTVAYVKVVCFRLRFSRYMWPIYFRLLRYVG